MLLLCEPESNFTKSNFPSEPSQIFTKPAMKAKMYSLKLKCFETLKQINPSSGTKFSKFVYI